MNGIESIFNRIEPIKGFKRGPIVGANIQYAHGSKFDFYREIYVSVYFSLLRVLGLLTSFIMRRREAIRYRPQLHPYIYRDKTEQNFQYNMTGVSHEALLGL